jgi:hypothetical protein
MLGRISLARSRCRLHLWCRFVILVLFVAKNFNLMIRPMNRPRVFRAVLALALVAAFVGSAVVLLVPAFRGTFESRLASTLGAMRHYQKAGPIIWAPPSFPRAYSA